MSTNGAGNGSISLASLRTVDEAKMVVRHPLGDRPPICDSHGNQLTLTLAADLHDATLEAETERQRSIQRTVAAQGELMAGEARDIDRRYLARRIVDWGPMKLTLTEGSPPLSAASIDDRVELLAEWDWLRQDLLVFFGRRTAFLQSQQPASSPTRSTDSTPSDPPPPEEEPSPITGGSERGAKGRRARAIARD